MKLSRSVILAAVVFVTVWLSRCRPAVLTPEHFASWVSDPANGLVQKKQVAVFDFSLQYWPPALRALRELGNVTVEFDSLCKAYHPTPYFVFSIAPTEGKASGDAMYSGISDYAEYDQRMKVLSFRVGEYWSLHAPDGRSFQPVLASMEQTYGLSPDRKIHLVFAPPDTLTSFHEMDWWDVQFQDDVFGTGLHHFVFRKKDWEAVPGVGE